MPEASPRTAMTHWRALSVMFIAQMLRYRHAACGVVQGEPLAAFKHADAGKDRAGG